MKIPKIGQTLKTPRAGCFRGLPPPLHYVFGGHLILCFRRLPHPLYYDFEDLYGQCPCGILGKHPYSFPHRRPAFSVGGVKKRRRPALPLEPLDKGRL